MKGSQVFLWRGHGYPTQDSHHANLLIYHVLTLSLKLVQELPRTFTPSEEKQVSVSEACACKPWLVKISRSANNLREFAPGVFALCTQVFLVDTDSLRLLECFQVQTLENITNAVNLGKISF